jgi:CubicO group peptidase (beta-lactamase class C family)
MKHFRLIPFLCPALWPAGPYFPAPERDGGWRALVTVNVAPSEEQKRAVRERARLEWDKIEQAWDYCRGFEGPHSVLIVRHGWIAGEWRTFEEPRGIASCTKSLTGVAVAKLIAQGKLKLNDPAYKFLPPEWAAAESARKQVRIRHMMTMSSGLDPYDGPYRDAEAYAKLILDRRVEAAPGTVWCYNSAPVDQFSLIVEKLTGQTMSRFFQAEIGRPIGLGGFEWPEFMGHTGGSGGPGGGARLTPRELARIGYLLLHKGSWAGRRVLAEREVRLLSSWAPFLKEAEFRTPNFWVTQPGSQNYYGHLFWTNRTRAALGKAVPSDTFYMSGFGMQACWIIPSLDMIVVRLGSSRALNSRIDFYSEFLARVMEAVR